MHYGKLYHMHKTLMTTALPQDNPRALSNIIDSTIDECLSFFTDEVTLVSVNTVPIVMSDGKPYLAVTVVCESSDIRLEYVKAGTTDDTVKDSLKSVVLNTGRDRRAMALRGRDT